MTSRMTCRRMNSTPTSTRFWRPCGTMLGRRKATRNTTSTSSAASTISRALRLISRSNPKMCRVQIGGHTKSSVPGAWNPSRASRLGSVVTSASQLPGPSCSALAVAADDEGERTRGADHDPDGQERVGPGPAVDQPADAAPCDDPGEQDADDRPGNLGTAWPLVARRFT